MTSISVSKQVEVKVTDDKMNEIRQSKVWEIWIHFIDTKRIAQKSIQIVGSKNYLRYDNNLFSLFLANIRHITAKAT